MAVILIANLLSAQTPGWERIGALGRGQFPICSEFAQIRTKQEPY